MGDPNQFSKNLDELVGLFGPDASGRVPGNPAAGAQAANRVGLGGSAAAAAAAQAHAAANRNNPAAAAAQQAGNRSSVGNPATAAQVAANRNSVGNNPGVRPGVPPSANRVGPPPQVGGAPQNPQAAAAGVNPALRARAAAAAAQAANTHQISRMNPQNPNMAGGRPQVPSGGSTPSPQQRQGPPGGPNPSPGQQQRQTSTGGPTPPPQQRPQPTGTTPSPPQRPQSQQPALGTPQQSMKGQPFRPATPQSQPSQAAQESGGLVTTPNITRTVVPQSTPKTKKNYDELSALLGPSSVSPTPSQTGAAIPGNPGINSNLAIPKTTPPNAAARGPALNTTPRGPPLNPATISPNQQGLANTPKSKNEAELLAVLNNKPSNPQAPAGPRPGIAPQANPTAANKAALVAALANRTAAGQPPQNTQGIVKPGPGQPAPMSGQKFGPGPQPNQQPAKVPIPAGQVGQQAPQYAPKVQMVQQQRPAQQVSGAPIGQLGPQMAPNPGAPRPANPQNPNMRPAGPAGPQVPIAAVPGKSQVIAPSQAAMAMAAVKAAAAAKAAAATKGAPPAPLLAASIPTGTPQGALPSRVSQPLSGSTGPPQSSAVASMGAVGSTAPALAGGLQGTPAANRHVSLNQEQIHIGMFCRFASVIVLEDLAHVSKERRAAIDIEFRKAVKALYRDWSEKKITQKVLFEKIFTYVRKINPNHTAQAFQSRFREWFRANKSTAFQSFAQSAGANKPGMPRPPGVPGQPGGGGPPNLPAGIPMAASGQLPSNLSATGLHPTQNPNVIGGAKPEPIAVGVVGVTGGAGAQLVKKPSVKTGNGGDPLRMESEGSKKGKAKPKLSKDEPVPVNPDFPENDAEGSSAGKSPPPGDADGQPPTKKMKTEGIKGVAKKGKGLAAADGSSLSDLNATPGAGLSQLNDMNGSTTMSDQTNGQAAPKPLSKKKAAEAAKALKRATAAAEAEAAAALAAASPSAGLLTTPGKPDGTQSGVVADAAGAGPAASAAAAVKKAEPEKRRGPDDDLDLVRMAGIDVDNEEDALAQEGQEGSDDLDLEGDTMVSLLNGPALLRRMNKVLKNQGLTNVRQECLEYISLAVRERICGVIERLVDVSKARSEVSRAHWNYHSIQYSSRDVRRQLEELRREEIRQIEVAADLRKRRLTEQDDPEAASVIDGANPAPVAKEEPSGPSRKAPDNRAMTEKKRQEDSIKQTNATINNMLSRHKLRMRERPKPAGAPGTTGAVNPTGASGATAPSPTKPPFPRPNATGSAGGAGNDEGTSAMDVDGGEGAKESQPQDAATHTADAATGVNAQDGIADGKPMEIDSASQGIAPRSDDPRSSRKVAASVGINRPYLIEKVPLTLRDCVFMMQRERQMSKSVLLYKTYAKLGSQPKSSG